MPTASPPGSTTNCAARPAASTSPICAEGTPSGRPRHDGDEPVGWAAVAPRADTTYARHRKIPHLDALPVSYPVDNGDARVDLTMAYTGIRKNFERAGFTHAADTTSVLTGHPRILMRLDLR